MLFLRHMKTLVFYNTETNQLYFINQSRFNIIPYGNYYTLNVDHRQCA